MDLYSITSSHRIEQRMSESSSSSKSSSARNKMMLHNASRLEKGSITISGTITKRENVKLWFSLQASREPWMNVGFIDSGLPIPAETAGLEIFGVINSSSAQLSPRTRQVATKVLFLSKVSPDGESNNVVDNPWFWPFLPLTSPAALFWFAIHCSRKVLLGKFANMF